ncbi:hypothetical protein FHP05_05260 [Cerasibacillus terrae]|uniref:Putative sugar diacid recognition domain-containing protein n=1 Tax=Cerasibacillus terrae TaxID=2498845 RepID=A0A5C8P0L2_9BACI|nr:sugar diacid recognition domain-containing protein [Cerasibacillus terrae]TXL66786.1 hypothetical protein FHP05_05260 [Cerasibacillus terrae]
MKITEELGNEIIKRLSKYTEVNINIMNLEGKIVSSTDKERVHQTTVVLKKLLTFRMKSFFLMRIWRISWVRSQE